MNTRLTAVLVSRFLIDLQEANKAKTGGQTSLSHMDSLNLTRASEGIGSLGSYIPAPWEAHCNEEESGSQTGNHDSRAIEVQVEAV